MIGAFFCRLSPSFRLLVQIYSEEKPAREITARPKKRHNAEDIIHKLHEADLLLPQGKMITGTRKPLGIIDRTNYRWRKEDGGMKVDQAPRLKEL